jgi:hypothetical protein
MGLFDQDYADAAVGYRNIKDAPEGSDLATIRACLEELWLPYEPYADSNFRGEFARQPDARFWEMYLAAWLLDAGHHLRPRAELPAAQRDAGPDICVRKGRRKIWIEIGGWCGSYWARGAGATDKKFQSEIGERERPRECASMAIICANFQLQTSRSSK